jgi:hypothetical protein
MGSLLERWWNDPEASASIAIAIVAAVFAIYQFRAMPAERRRRILAAMVEHYADSKFLRTRVLTDLPALLHQGYAAIQRAIDERIAELERRNSAGAEEAAMSMGELGRLYRLRQEAQICNTSQLGVSYTSASEILHSEYKLRALLWAIEAVRTAEADDTNPLHDVIKDARDLVNKVNDFALEYENGAYRPRTLLGLWHRSIVVTVKAVEPIVWSGSVDGRWGRRVLRLGIAAQHYNDVTRIHRSSEIVWVAGGSTRSHVVAHPARTIDIFGKEIVNSDLPRPYATRSMLLLRIRAFYWAIIGKLGLTPTYWIFAYGGSRLRRHSHDEDTLAACMRFVLKSPSTGDVPSADFGWDLPGVRREMAQVAKQMREASRKQRNQRAVSDHRT